ncbi:hypothetical protein D3C75_966930 [compost metagenome]
MVIAEDGRFAFVPGHGGNVLRQSCQVNKRLKGGARLPGSGEHPVKLVFLVILAPYHGLDVPVPGVDGDQRRLQLRIRRNFRRHSLLGNFLRPQIQSRIDF